MLFLILFILVLAVFLCVFVATYYLNKKTNASSHIINVNSSNIGITSVVHDNASKTVKDSMNGAIDTLNAHGIKELNLENFYNSLNKSKG